MDHHFFYGVMVGIGVGCFGVYILAMLKIGKKRIPAAKPGAAMARVIKGGRDEQGSI